MKSRYTYTYVRDFCLLRYTLGLIFGQLLKQDIDEFVEDWNNHYIRKNRLSISPHGRPNDLYEYPELQGVYSYCGRLVTFKYQQPCTCRCY